MWLRDLCQYSRTGWETPLRTAAEPVFGKCRAHSKVHLKQESRRRRTYVNSGCMLSNSAIGAPFERRRMYPNYPIYRLTDGADQQSWGTHLSMPSAQQDCLNK
jgi:hypothetical protein